MSSQMSHVQSGNKRVPEIYSKSMSPQRGLQSQSPRSSTPSHVLVESILDKYPPKRVYKEVDVRKRPIELTPDYDEAVANIMKKQHHDSKYESMLVLSNSHRSYENRVTFGPEDEPYEFRSRGQSDAQENFRAPDDHRWNEVHEPTAISRVEPNFGNQSKNVAYVETVSRQPTYRSENNTDNKTSQSPGPKLPKDIPLNNYDATRPPPSDVKNHQATRSNPITQSRDVTNPLSPLKQDIITPPVNIQQDANDNEEKPMVEEFEFQFTGPGESTSEAQVVVSPAGNRLGEKAKESEFVEMEQPAGKDWTTFERPPKNKSGHQYKYRTDQNTPNSEMSASSTLKDANQNEESTVHTEFQSLTMKPESKERSDITLESPNNRSK